MIRRVPIEILPRKNKLVLEPLPEEESISAGGIYIPATPRDTPVVMKVLAVGSEVTDIEPGMRVMVGKYAATEFHPNGKACVILRDDEVMAIVRELPREEGAPEILAEVEEAAAPPAPARRLIQVPG